MNPIDLLKEYEEKINLHDFDQVEHLISKNAVFWFSDGSFTGLEQIRGAFERTWSRILNEKYWLQDLVCLSEHPELACFTYEFHWTGQIDGQSHSGKGRGTAVLRIERGRWRILHEHLSKIPTL